MRFLAKTRSIFKGRPSLWAAAGAFGFLLIAYCVHGIWFQKQPPILLVVAPPHAWQAITDSQKNGILVLLKDQLEFSHHQTVLLSPPPDEVPVQRVEVSGRGDNGQLMLELNISRQHQSRRFTSGYQHPKASMHAALDALGAEDPNPYLLPEQTQNFWLLASATGHAAEDMPSPFQEALSRASQQETGCAGIHASLGALVYQGLKRSTNSADHQAQWVAEKHYQKALKIIPDYPRALASFAHFKTDCGQGVEAMELLRNGIQTFGASAELYQAMSHPARVSGLLQGAVNAIEKGGKLLQQGQGPALWVEKTYLYGEQWDTFEDRLSKGTEGSAERDFYRGYISLLKGNQNRALLFFTKAQKSAYPQSPYAKLSSVFESHLMGQREDALALLRQLALHRKGLRALDGEFTFRLAETFVFLNQPVEALEMAEKAFAQGFVCGSWFKQSPMLVSLAGNARWEDLLSRVEERQRYISRLFQGEWFSHP